MSNNEVVAYVRENIASGLEPEVICENLMTRCLAPDCQMAGLGCDNMTVVIVCLLQGGTYEDLQKKCATEAEIEKSNDDVQVNSDNEPEFSEDNMYKEAKEFLDKLEFKI